MTNSQGPWNGRFVWYDLMTTDATKAQAFYCALFDWQVEEVPMPGFSYRMIMAGPGPIGGIVEEKSIPVSHWMPYCAVPDVDAAANRCAQLGGSVCVQPTDIPHTGRFAVIGDPLGAYLTVYKGLPTAPGCDPDLPVPGRVCWNELLSSDDTKAQAFYSAMFGWQPEAKDLGPMGTYRVQILEGKQAGGIMRNPQHGAPDAWLVYFGVTDLKKMTERAKQRGANILMANVPIEGIGAFSMFTDPAGATAALFQVA